MGGLAAGTADSRGTVREITDSGLPDKAHSLFQDARGRLWVGTPSGVAFSSPTGLSRRIRPSGVVYSFADDSAGNVWVSHQEGLLRLFPSVWSNASPRPGSGADNRPVLSCMMPCRVVYGLDFETVGSRIQARSAPHLVLGRRGAGRGHGPRFLRRSPRYILGPHGGGTEPGSKTATFSPLTSQNGLPCDTVHSMIEDDARSVWLYLACGLVRIGWYQLDAWASHPQQTIHATVFDGSDGVTSHRLLGRL